MSDTETILSRLSEIVGAGGLVRDPAERDAHLIDQRKRYHGKALAVVMPASVEDVAAIVRLAAETKTGIVPQGGNTSLCGGATPDDSGREIVLSLRRMNRVRAVDPVGNTMVVEAGCTLQAVHEAAIAVDRLFPLDVAPAARACIGGNLSTNAGGVQVLRYGNARELTLGLEVVLPSGEIWNGLRSLRKDNSGYDLKQIFIGAEGTLGIITAAALKLFAHPKSRVMGFVALDSVEAALALLAHLRARCGERLSAFELISSLCMDIVQRVYPELPKPFEVSHHYVALVEFTDAAGGDALRRLALDALRDAAREGISLGVRLANDEAQALEFWQIRKNISDAQAAEGGNLKHDISLPIAHIPEFIETMGETLREAIPGVQLVVFGHLGDGNLHYNVGYLPGVKTDLLTTHGALISRTIHDEVNRLGGSIAAEHGVGQYKRDELPRYKAPVELELMRTLKRTLDPLGIMNPGKVV